MRPVPPPHSALDPLVTLFPHVGPRAPKFDKSCVFIVPFICLNCHRHSPIYPDRPLPVLRFAPLLSWTVAESASIVFRGRALLTDPARPHRPLCTPKLGVRKYRLFATPQLRCVSYEISPFPSSASHRCFPGLWPGLLASFSVVVRC